MPQSYWHIRFHVIRPKTITLTIYNVICEECGAEGPDALSELEAHQLAIKNGWEFIEDFYICPDRKHAPFKAMYKLQKDLKDWQQEQD
jgi:hypothetical protein